MKIIKPWYKIESKLNYVQMLKNIERAGRTCYKSEAKITKDSAEDFVKNVIIKSGHLSVIEHEGITVRFVVDRGVTHEIVRHRLSSFSQESTRYCNYSKAKFGNEVTFIKPSWVSDDVLLMKKNTKWDFGPDDITSKSGYLYNEKTKTSYPIDYSSGVWLSSMAVAEHDYFDALEGGWSAQQARSILPNSLKTEIVVTANLRQWRLIFDQRTSKKAHPQMREVMCPLLIELQEKLPAFFGDLKKPKI